MEKNIHIMYQIILLANMVTETEGLNLGPPAKSSV